MTMRFSPRFGAEAIIKASRKATVSALRPVARRSLSDIGCSDYLDEIAIQISIFSPEV
jgi:hypothetical protein